MMFPVDFCVPYCIHRKERVDREMAMYEAFRRLQITPCFFDAIDGNTAPNKPDDLRPGNWGCALSKSAIYKRCYETNKNCLLLEDDIVVHPDVIGVLNEAIKELPENWGALFLGCDNATTPCEHLNGKNRSIQAYSDTLDIVPLPIQNHAVIIRHQYLKDLADYLTDPQTYDRKQGRYFSDYATAHWFAAREMTMYRCNPQIVRQYSNYSDNEKRWLTSGCAFGKWNKKAATNAAPSTHATRSCYSVGVVCLGGSSTSSDRMSLLSNELHREKITKYTVSALPRQNTIGRDNENYEYTTHLGTRVVRTGDFGLALNVAELLEQDGDILVLENDAVLCDNFSQRIQTEVIDYLPDDWSIVNIGWSRLFDKKKYINEFILEVDKLYGTTAVLYRGGQWRKFLINEIRSQGIYKIPANISNHYGIDPVILNWAKANNFKYYVTSICYVGQRGGQNEIRPNISRPSYPLESYGEMHTASKEPLLANGMVVCKSLDFIVTTTCNLKCKQCCQLNHMSRRNIFDTDFLLESLRQWSKKLDIQELRITGGEPLLHPHIKNIVSKCKDIVKCNIGVWTNGVLLTQNIADHFANNGVSTIVSQHTKAMPDIKNLYGRIVPTFSHLHFYDYDSNGLPIYPNSPPEKAVRSNYGNRPCPFCHTLLGGMLYQCSMIAHRNGLVQEGVLPTEWSGNGLSCDCAPVDVYRMFNKAIDAACAGCRLNRMPMNIEH